MSNEVFESNLSHFKIIKRWSHGAQCTCPAHDDQKASLTITKGNKCTLFRCHAGCSYDQILTAAGLQKKDTYYDIQPQQRVSKLQYWLEHNAIRYDYHRLDTGQYDSTKWRTPDKGFQWGRYTSGIYDKSTEKNPINRHTLSVFCNGQIKALIEAVVNGTLICYTEGEKDCITLWRDGYISFTFGGTNTFKDEILPYAERDIRLKKERYRNSVIWKMLQMINKIIQSDYLGLNEQYVKLLAEYQAEFADTNLALETLDMFLCIKSNEDEVERESLPFKDDTPQDKKDCPFE